MLTSSLKLFIYIYIKILLSSIIFFLILTNVNIFKISNDTQSRLNSLFGREIVNKFKRIPQSHIIKQIVLMPVLDIELGEGHKF